MRTLKQILIDSFTGLDGKSWDALKLIGYPSCLLAVVIFLSNSVFLTITKGTFDAVAFGGGFAAIMGGLLAVGAGVAVKGNTEPKT